MLAGAEARLAAAVEALGRHNGKASSVFSTIEPEGTTAAEELEERLDASRGWLGVFARGVTEDASQYTLGLVKSYYPEVDLEMVGDRMAPDTSGLA